jgi:hypothetical protein
VRSPEFDRLTFEKPLLGETTPHLKFLGAQAIGRLDFPLTARTGSTARFEAFDSQFEPVRSSNLEMSIFV